MKSTNDKRERGAWMRSSSSSSLALSLLLVGCQAPEGEGPVEAIPPRADLVRVEAAAVTSAAQAEADTTRAAQELRWMGLWFAAGGTSLPDLSAALATVRLEERAAALNLLRRDLDGPEGTELRSFFAATLRDPETPDLRWCEAARACGRLSLHEEAEVLALSLEAESGSRRVAAREALFRLRGVWLEDVAAAQVILGDGSPPSKSLTAALLATTERLREHAAALYLLDPARATAALDDPDPVIRAAAVQALLGALSLEDPEPDLEPERVRMTLLERVKVEPHPLVLHDLIEGFLEQLGPTDVCTRDSHEFASAMHARAPACDEATLAPIVYGLARMPLDASIPAKDEAGVPDACSLGYATAMLVGDPEEGGHAGLFNVWVRGERRLERDAVASALRSLEVLFDRPLADTPRTELREVLFEIIEDEAREPGIRAGAVRVVARSGRPEDLPRLGVVLEGAPTSVAYELIATISRLAEGVEATTESAIAARDALVGMLSRGEASLRRRALAMLASEPLAHLAETTDAGLFLAVLEQDLSVEESITLLELLASRGDSALVPELMAHSAFARLAAANSGVSTVLTETLGRLAEGNGPLTHEVASRLLETPLSSEGGDVAASEGVQRLRNALALFALLDDSAAQDLNVEQHADVVRWAMELREAAGTLAGVTTESVPTAFLVRLTDLHLPECDPESEHGFWAHPTALLNADLFAALKLKRTDDQWEVITARTRIYFQHARQYATTKTGDVVDEWEVSRDLARFLVSMEETAQALQQYRWIVEQESSSGVTPSSSVLDLSDLRQAAALAAEEEPEEPALTPTAFDLTLTLVEREHWMSEPAGVRLGDLGGLVERGRGSEANIATLRLVFEGLPVPGIDPDDAELPEGARWLGIQADPEGLAELHKLKASLDAPASVDEAPTEPALEDAPEEAGGVPLEAQGEDPASGS